MTPRTISQNLPDNLSQSSFASRMIRYLTQEFSYPTLPLSFAFARPEEAQETLHIGKETPRYPWSWHLTINSFFYLCSCRFKPARYLLTEDILQHPYLLFMTQQPNQGGAEAEQQKRHDDEKLHTIIQAHDEHACHHEHVNHEEQIKNDHYFQVTR